MNLNLTTILIPAKNELNITSVLESIVDEVKIPFECIVVEDSFDDLSIQFVDKVSQNDKRFRVHVNSTGNSPALAIKAGLAQAKGNVFVITMADGSDDPADINKLVKLVHRGATIACASRYMPGGQQVGAPAVKSFLSKLAGKSLYYLRKVGTRDATNSFKAYDAEFIRKVGIESQFGFEMGIELIAKAKILRKPVAEVPTVWIEKINKKSNFQLKKWLYQYIYWYVYAFKSKAEEKQYE